MYTGSSERRNLSNLRISFCVTPHFTRTSSNACLGANTAYSFFALLSVSCTAQTIARCIASLFGVVSSVLGLCGGYKLRSLMLSVYIK